jgi:cardiolipin synthase
VRHIPNLICVLRVALIWPILASIVQGQYRLTLFLFFVAAASDALDGYLAKRFRWSSELGKYLDPIADKLLLMFLFVVLTWYGLIPWVWLTVIAIARDFLIGLGAIAYRIGWGRLRGSPMITSKVNTLLQLLYVLAIVARQAFDLPGVSVIDALGVLTAISVSISGFLYVREFTQRALTVARA